MRKIYEVARDITKAWPKVNFAALPYLRAMLQLSSPTDMYVVEDARSVVLYFLANASGFRGPQAKALKAELQEIIK